MTETMTTEQAIWTIKFLHEMCDHYYCLQNGKGRCEDCAEAVDMAIKALEEKQKIIRCKDCRYNIRHKCYADNISGRRVHVKCAEWVDDDWFCADGRKKDD